MGTLLLGTELTMDERVVKFRVGVMVLSTMFIAGILVLLFGDARSIARGSYTIYMHFTDAPGVTDGTPVRKSGILIGRVTNVRFADQGGVIVEAKIDGKVKIYHSEVPQVSGSLLGGDVVIQFVHRDKLPAVRLPENGTAKPQTSNSTTDPTEVLTGAEGENPPAAPKTATPKDAAQKDAAEAGEPDNGVVQEGEYIEGTVAPNPFQVISNLEGDMSKAVGSLATAGDEVAKLAGYFNRMLTNNDEQIARIINKTEQTLDTFQRSLANVDDVLGNDEVRENLKRTISELPELLTETRGAMTTVRTTVESVDRNLRNLEGFTGPLSERGDQIITNVDQAVARLDQLLGDLSAFSRNLNRGEGSIGQLLRNPDLYQHLNAAAINIEQITCELKPILADARVFSDKIARHPELLGVRGAIQKSPGTK